MEITKNEGKKDAKIAGAVGRTLGVGTRKLYNSTGMNYFTAPAAKLTIGIADVSNEVQKLKKKQKEDLANGLEVVKGA